MKLSEFISQAGAIERALIESGGEISPTLEKEMLSVDLDQREAIDGAQVMLDRLEALADYWKARAENYSKIADSIELSRFKLKKHIKDVMSFSGNSELIGLEWRLKLCPAKAKIVIDENLLSKEYYKEKITLVPDKIRIEEDLKLGVPVEGAAFEKVYTLRTYPNKKEIA